MENSRSKKILVVSNLYPPLHVGGYEIVCKSVVDGLRTKGHRVHVLTSRYRIGKEKKEQDLYRYLSFHDFRPQSIAALILREIRDRLVTDRVFRKVKPDAVLIWNMGGIPKSVLFSIQDMGVPIWYVFQDQWLLCDNWWKVLWETKSRSPIREVFKRMLRLARVKELTRAFFPYDMTKLDLRRAVFVSKSLKEKYEHAGFSVMEAPVIYNGIDLEVFHAGRRISCSRILIMYGGTIDRRKGVDTLIDAASILLKKKDMRLVVNFIGDAVNDGEYKAVLDQIRREGIVENVNMFKKKSQDELARFYRFGDIFVFPSKMEEGFPLSTLEAMASGMALVGTTRGGSADILKDGENCLTFEAGDAHGLACCIEQLVTDAGLRMRLADAGGRMVRERFSRQRMIDQYEHFLNDEMIQMEPFVSKQLSN